MGSRFDNRYAYRKMTPADLARMMLQMDIRPGTLARIIGVQRRTVESWIEGSMTIPQYVWVLLYVWQEHRPAIAMAREAAARSIEYDNKLREPWPYLDGKSPEQIMKEMDNAH